MKKILSALFLLLLIDPLHAQTDADALRFSMLNYGSTARSLGMGNSFGALGADASCLAMNPAGIGLYRRSEASISPVFSNRSVGTTYLGTQASDDFFKLAFGNLGVVWADDDKRIAFGISYNRTNEFSSRYIAEGNNPDHSLLDSYREEIASSLDPGLSPGMFYQANVSPEDLASFYPFDINLAWNTFLIDTIDIAGSPRYFTAVPFAGTLQRRVMETRGGSGEWDFTLGGKVNNNLYLGFTLGITSLRYVEESTWSEFDVKDTIPFFREFQYNQSLSTTGSGVNLKFGAIFRPSDYFRFGAAIHSPTWYTLVDEYTADMRADLDNGDVYDDIGPAFIPFDYRVNTPLRFIGSAAFIFLQQGAINIDYEFTDYGLARINPVDRSFRSDFIPLNQAIRLKYTSTHAIRAGFEWRYETLRFRAGAFYTTSPFDVALRSSTATDMSQMGLTGGLGYRGDKYYFDVAYAWSKIGSFIRPYTLEEEDVEGITFDQRDNRVMFTAGYFF